MHPRQACYNTCMPTQISERTDKYLHSKLPIDQDEKILAVYRHHWFAYAANWIVGAIIVVVVMALAVGLTMVGGDNGSFAQHRSAIIAAAGVFSTLVLLGTFIPVYLRSQEQVVLTEEALVQTLQPSLFSSKVDHLNLHRIDDVSVRQDFLGTVLGYGHITIETPGEQDNYEFYMLPAPHEIARSIAQARESYEAAMQSGRMPTTVSAVQPPAIDPQQYQQFLQYQQMVQQSQQAPAPAQNQPPQAPEQGQNDQPNQ